MSDELRDRYAARLDDDDVDDEEEKDDSNAMNAMREESVWNVGNVKKEWKGWTVYLPEEYLDDVQDESKLLDVRLDREVRMDRHFKPLLVALGMERLERMDDKEVVEFLERMERGTLEE